MCRSAWRSSVASEIQSKIKNIYKIYILLDTMRTSHSSNPFSNTDDDTPPFFKSSARIKLNQFGFHVGGQLQSSAPH